MQGKIMADHCAILVFRVARRREVYLFSSLLLIGGRTLQSTVRQQQNKTKHYYTTIVATFGFCLEYVVLSCRARRETLDCGGFGFGDSVER